MEGTNNSNILQVSIEEEMKVAYIDYSMSVIVSRALPDVRDGLKPVHRRILFGMSELGLSASRSHKKSARIVGEVLGKYHPHGDSAVYESMVRMAQNWSLRYPLVDGQGNFGSIDGDNPAAMRYTEARLRKLSEEMLTDIKKDVVEYRLNFDDSLYEPTVLPAKLPQLLMNGASGIAVGMATNMPPHNLSEVIKGVMAYIDNNEITIDELMEHISAPDFPTGGIIYGYEGVKSAFHTGRGRIVLRAVAEIQEEGTRTRIIVTELPYQVNKSSLIQKTAELVNTKKIDGITGIRDESDRDGMRIVYELRRDAIPRVVLNNLFKYTQLQNSFSVNNVVLVKGRPYLLNLKDIIKYFVEHRHEVVIRRATFDLKKAEERSHILEGLLLALDRIDDIIKLIRGSKDADTARAALMGQTEFGNMKPFSFSEKQAKAILEMRLQRLTGLERDKIQAEFDELMKLVNYLKEVLASEPMRMGIIKDELADMLERFGDDRMTAIEQSSDEINIEDIIADEEMVITISNEGYIKRTALSEYKTQSRGGQGSRGASSKDKDFTEHIFVASMHNYLLIFTDKGKVYWKRVYEIPEGSKTAKGKPLQNLINIEKGEKVQAYINLENIKDPDYLENRFLIFCTEKGKVKKTALKAYSRPRQGGINAITINEGDTLLDVKLTTGNSEIIMATKSGRAIRFSEARTRPIGRTSSGMKGITLRSEDDKVIGLVCSDDPNDDILVVSENGYGKRTALEAYRVTNRGGKGVTTLKITEKTGELVSIKRVNDDDDLMIIKKSGVTIRFHLSDLRTMGRATQGVRLLRVTEKDGISSVAKVPREDEEEEIQEGVEGAEVTEGNVENTENPTDNEPSNEEDDKNEE
jgi:DNA gyrase subunit A